MMLNIEILKNGEVENVILADEAFAEANLPPGTWRVAAVQPVETAPVAPTPEWEWLIDIGPFFDRFGAAKMAVLTSADAGVQAILKDVQIRKWLDLKLPDLAQSVAYVGTKVPAVTAELQAAILNTPVAPDENLALRKLYFS